jgi:putative FmdB family regulatory protein
VPTYEYRCKACSHQLEIVQGFTDDALTTCPSCGAEQLRKVFGSVGISFKGSGFYKNDSRGKTASTATASSTGDGSGSAEKSSTDKSSTDKSSTDKSSSESTTSTKTSSTAEAKSA